MVIEKLPKLNPQKFAIEIMRRECLTSFLRYVTVIYKAKYGRDFVVKKHHIIIAKALMRVFTGECKRLIINVAPRYGKTEMAVKMFISLGLAFNAAAKFIHLSYSDNLALDNSEYIKDYVNSEAYQKLFPHVKIKKGSDSKQKWTTVDGGGVYATSTAGQVTGFGAGQVEQPDEEQKKADEALSAFLDLLETHQAEFSVHQQLWNGAPDFVKEVFKNFFGAIVIDDPIKPEDAESEKVRTNVNHRFDSTIRSRVNSKNTPIILIMQRLHPDDLAGYLLREEPGVWEVVSIPAWNEQTDEVLDASKHTAEDFKKMKKRDPITLARQYQQNPKPREGLLYKPFETYMRIPPGATRVRAFCDPADTGTDYLACVFYRLFNNQAYVVDIIYTQERAETTEIEIAEQASRLKCERIRFESNNGGRLLGRFVKQHCRGFKNLFTRFEFYAQTKNKEARILNAASEVNNFFIFPEGWDEEYPEAFKSMEFYTAQGKNLHDDLQDCLTAIYEHEKIKAKSGMRKTS